MEASGNPSLARSRGRGGGFYYKVDMEAQCCSQCVMRKIIGLLTRVWKALQDVLITRGYIDVSAGSAAASRPGCWLGRGSGLRLSVLAKNRLSAVFCVSGSVSVHPSSEGLL